MKFNVEERKCIVCGSTEKEVFHKRDPWTQAVIVKDDDDQVIHGTDVMCTECGLIYKNPMMDRKSLNEFYSDGTYLNIYKGGLAKQISKKWLIENVINTVYILDFFKKNKFSVDGKKCLDVGAGSGTLMKGLRSLGADVYGVEPCTRHCEIAEKVYGNPVWNGSFEDFETDEKFDLITISNTLEHFYDPNDILKKAKAMLSENGNIVIEVPSARYPYPATLTSAFYSSAHNYTWQAPNMAAMLHKNGLRIKYFGYEGHKKCMLFIVDNPRCINWDGKHESMIAGEKALTIGQLKDVAKMNQNLSLNAQQLNTELLEGSSVNSINEKINTVYSGSNVLRYVVANKCFEIDKIEDGLGIIQQPYEKAQSADFNYCQGSQLFTIAIGYRMLGDFITTKSFLDQALEVYPGIEKYNFVKEMYVDGIISESGFSSYAWFSCKTLLKSFS